METTISSVIDVFKKFVNSKKKEIFVRLVIVLIYFCLGLSLVSRVRNYVIFKLNTFQTNSILTFIRGFVYIGFAGFICNRLSIFVSGFIRNDCSTLGIW